MLRMITAVAHRPRIGVTRTRLPRSPPPQPRQAHADPDAARAQAIPPSFASLLMNTGVADARAKAVQILDKFATFDLEAAKRGK